MIKLILRLIRGIVMRLSRLLGIIKKDSGFTWKKYTINYAASLDLYSAATVYANPSQSSGSTVSFKYSYDAYYDDSGNIQGYRFVNVSRLGQVTDDYYACTAEHGSFGLDVYYIVQDVITPPDINYVIAPTEVNGGVITGSIYHISADTSRPRAGTYIEDVSSENQNAYPSNGVQDGYYYILNG